MVSTVVPAFWTQNIKPKHTLLKCSVILFGLGTPVLMVRTGTGPTWTSPPSAWDLPDRVEGSLAAVGLRLFDGHLAA